MRVAYLGPAGTFTEEALRASLPDRADGPVEELPYPTVYETVMAVQEGTADRAIVPIENSLEGGVAATLDALAGEAHRVRIAAEVVHPIRHCVIAARELPLDEVTRVVSHPQATAQCGRFLRERLARAERVEASSTADAVRQVADAAEPWAALGSRLSAELYGCRLLAAGVEDHPGNLTRFVWLAPDGELDDHRTRTRTSVVFWGAGDESPGWLVSALREFSDRGINLTKIESRPRPPGASATGGGASGRRLGHYMFFADLDGDARRPPVSDALAALGRRVEAIRVLGSYPAG